MAAQHYKNHTRRLPLYYTGGGLILAANFLWAIYSLLQNVSGASIVAATMSLALLALVYAARVQTLTVQDRVIRLEMRIRLKELLPADVAAKAAALPVKQLVALRFAGDGELPGLVREVLQGTLTAPNDIKLRIADWQEDHLRA